MTRRERLEKKLEKRLDWAESRDKKSDAAHARVHEIADGIPFGQPILVGHHSERRARRDQERMDAGMRASIDNSRAADDHRSKADGIERALATSVFSDDEDAVERLTEIVAELEAKRDRMKAYNALRRKRKSDTEGFAEDFAAAGVTDDEARGLLSAIRVVPYQIKHGAFPAYELSNLGATIRQKKQRIEQITRERAQAEAGVRAGGRVMASRYGGVCPDCEQPFAKGEQIVWYRTTREACHAVCPDQEGAAASAVKAVGAPVSAAELEGDPASWTVPGDGYADGGAPYDPDELAGGNLLEDPAADARAKRELQTIARRQERDARLGTSAERAGDRYDGSGQEGR